MFRPPSYVNEYFNNNMLDQIDNVFSYYEDVVLMWNLNYDYKPVLMHSKLHQIEVQYGMQQLISSPTRMTLTTSSLIDAILTNDHESHVLTGV